MSFPARLRRTAATSTAIVAFTLCFLLPTGCGIGTLAPVTAQTGVDLHMTGHVFGGQQPVVGAHVHVFQASYASSGKSTDLIALKSGTHGNPNPVTTSDTLGQYIATDANGNFAITGEYFCQGGGPVYLLATQGNPGLAAGANNPALALLAVVADSCSNGATLSSSLVINVNEISTVTGVFALSGYLNGPGALLYPGTSTAANPVGLTNAADTALSLTNISYGTVNATTSTGGVVSAAAITTLADMLASCINSDGSTAPVVTGGMSATPACGTLFANATSDGTSTGIQPTDTVTAMLNIAHHPAANVPSLYALVTPTAPFAGGLATAPNDWTLSIAYPRTAIQLISPGVPAVDASGNVWFASTTPLIGSSYVAAELSPVGLVLNYSVVNNQPAQVAIDPNGNAWVAQRSGGVVSKIVPSGSVSTYPTETDFPYNGSSNDNGRQIAIDASGDVYVFDYTNQWIYELTNSGTVAAYEQSNYLSGGVAILNASTVLSFENTIVGLQATLGNQGSYVCGSLQGCRNGGLSSSSAFAVDSNAHIAALNNNNTLSLFDSTGKTNASSGGYLTGSPFSGGGLNTTTKGTNQPNPWLAIDGGNNVWVANYTGSLSEFNSAGIALSPSAGTGTGQPGGYYGSSPSCKGQGLAIDGSGNVWVSCDSTTVPVLEYIGAAVPVATPLLPGNFGVKP